VADVREVFAASVRRERLARGWSAADLAIQAGTAQGTITNIECNRHGTSLALAAKLADAFGLTIGALADGPKAGHA
jgi:transcriptional regulator with XRE-family HTH domain